MFGKALSESKPRIASFCNDVCQAVVHHEIQAKLGKARSEFVEVGIDQQTSCCPRCVESNETCGFGLRLPDTTNRPLDRRQARLKRIVKALPFLGQGHVTCCAMEQPNIQLLFECLKTLGKGGPRHAQLGGRFGKAQVAGYVGKPNQLREERRIHGEPYWSNFPTTVF